MPYFSSLSEAMSILKNSHKHIGNDAELRAELHRKDEELRKIQKNMTQWKVKCPHYHENYSKSIFSNPLQNVWQKSLKMS